MRTKKSFKNMTIAIISNIITIIIGFVIQTIFIKTLGTDYLGVDKLFSNIISMLSIVEDPSAPSDSVISSDVSL